MEEVHRLSDEETRDDLMRWVIVEAVHDRKLPEVSELQDRARELCLYRDIEIPDGSPLRRKSAERVLRPSASGPKRNRSDDGRTGRIGPTTRLQSR